MILKTDYFTPLSQAVASIDRDSFAARFAVYDREHKALLRRLATADARCSAADVAREEQAFRDAIRRIEFADGDDLATLVPKDEPAAEEARVDAVWPEPRAPRREALDASSVPNLDHFESAAVEPIMQLSEPRSVARRVGERLALAALVLVLTGVGLWMVEGRRGETTDTSLHGVVESTQPAASDAADAKAQQPTWLSPEMFYAPPPMPSSPPPRADAPRR